MWTTIDDQSRALLTRLYSAATTLVGVALVGAVGYHWLGDGRWTWSDCLYMSIITLSTVGFGEMLPGMHDVGGARVWTVVLIVLGSGTLVYFASTFTAMVVEGDLQGALRRRRMNRQLEHVRDHVILCGVGATGIHVAAELHQSSSVFVVVDSSLERIERLAQELQAPLLYVVGDATTDHVLESAGIARARGVIAALTDDRDNLFVVVTARALSERIRIVSKAVEPENVVKLKRAGADSVVAPSYIGGVRMASEMVRPSVVQFMDAMVRERDSERRIDELLITAESPLAGRSLADARLRDGMDTLVMAIRYADGGHEYNPAASIVLRAGMVLVVLVRSADVETVRAYVSGRRR